MRHGYPSEPRPVRRHLWRAAAVRRGGPVGGSVAAPADRAERPGPHRGVEGRRRTRSGAVTGRNPTGGPSRTAPSPAPSLRAGVLRPAAPPTAGAAGARRAAGAPWLFRSRAASRRPAPYPPGPAPDPFGGWPPGVPLHVTHLGGQRPTQGAYLSVQRGDQMFATEVSTETVERWKSALTEALEPGGPSEAARGVAARVAGDCSTWRASRAARSDQASSAGRRGGADDSGVVLQLGRNHPGPDVDVRQPLVGPLAHAAADDDRDRATAAPPRARGSARPAWPTCPSPGPRSPGPGRTRGPRRRDRRVPGARVRCWERACRRRTTRCRSRFRTSTSEPPRARPRPAPYRTSARPGGVGVVQQRHRPTAPPRLNNSCPGRPDPGLVQVRRRAHHPVEDHAGKGDADRDPPARPRPRRLPRSPPDSSRRPGCGVSNRCRSPARSPAATSTGAPLTPEPPTSIPTVVMASTSTPWRPGSQGETLNRCDDRPPSSSSRSPPGAPART